MKNQNPSNWMAIIIIGVLVMVTMFSCTTSSGTAVESVPNTPATSNSSNPSPDSSTTSKELTLNSNSSRPSDAVYIYDHYYKILLYPSSITDYEASKSYSKKACNNLQGYPAVLEVGDERDLVGEYVAKFQKEHPGETFFVCEWDN